MVQCGNRISDRTWHGRDSFAEMPWDLIGLDIPWQHERLEQGVAQTAGGSYNNLGGGRGLGTTRIGGLRRGRASPLAGGQIAPGGARYQTTRLRKREGVR